MPASVIERVTAFVEDRAENKRSKLIDQVLQRPEYASLWALKLCDLSMIRKEHLGRKNTIAVDQWFTEQFLANQPWDQLVRDLITASGSIEENPATGPVFAKFPNLFAPASIRLERLFQNTVRSMVKIGWHKPSTKWPTGKIGLLTWDTPDYRYAMDHGYLAGLKEAEVGLVVRINAGHDFDVRTKLTVRIGVGQVAIPCVTELVIAPCPLFLAGRDVVVRVVNDASLGLVIVTAEKIFL